MTVGKRGTRLDASAPLTNDVCGAKSKENAKRLAPAPTQFQAHAPSLGRIHPRTSRSLHYAQPPSSLQQPDSQGTANHTKKRRPRIEQNSAGLRPSKSGQPGFRATSPVCPSIPGVSPSTMTLIAQRAAPAAYRAKSRLRATSQREPVGPKHACGRLCHCSSSPSQQPPVRSHSCER